jgi:hypothetical protein
MPRIRRRISCFCWTALVSFILSSTNGCGKPSNTVSGLHLTSIEKPNPAGNSQDPPSVTFKIRPAIEPTLPNVEIYDCVYNARGRTAKFRLQLRQDRPTSREIPLAPAEGKFIAVAGSDNSAILEDLMKALEAKDFPGESSRISELAFDAVVLGERQSRSSGGGYSDNPRGNWKVFKLFFPKGGDDGELFLNLNPVLGEAELSMKDSDYGDYLLTQLAKVL